MKKLFFSALIVSMGMLMVVSGMNQAKVKADSELTIAQPSKALIAVKTVRGISSSSVDLDEGGSQDVQVSANGKIKITNNIQHALKINHIKCTTAGLSTPVKIALNGDRRLKPGESMTADIKLNARQLPADIKYLSFELDAQWQSGHAIITFHVRVHSSEEVE